MRRPITIETAPWTHDGWITGKDIVTAVKLIGCLIAALAPSRFWPVTSRTMARAHLRIRGGSARLLKGLDTVLDRDAHSLARDAMAADYLFNTQAIREILPGQWQCEARLAGCEALDLALQQSRGAVLWCSPFVGSDLAPKKALTLAGYPVTHLSAPSHPYSPTRFGTLLLNPVRLRAVNRYLARRVIVVHGNAQPALDVLRQVLMDNGVVLIMAVGTGKRSLSFPFFGGTTHLALGAPRLAYSTGAALIPVFTLPGESGGYRVELGPDLTPGSKFTEVETLHKMASRYVDLLAPNVRAHPAHWEGWFHPATWQSSSS